ncbi:FtsB family cell division protein [Raoultibacter phocaeensis]|uniref:FtsB family cell division protein n=1 Tax=Raoultibacter phocaeensis TaxID=2479841 RepID=UPI0015D5F252|nr:septum formation initiator family protein [Raoultibacter phocaeensis]
MIRTSWDEEPEVDDFEETKTSRIDKLKRSVAKNKAGKAFTRQFGSGDSDASSGGSRAALYKGEMGKKHKQASRMQGNPGKSMGASKKRFSGISLNPRSPKFVASLMVAACLVLSCVFLYPTAQQYYVAVRERDQLQAEYDALQQRNQTIKAEVDNLSTDAGIEDRARREFGWVKQDEHAANVYGIDAAEDESTYNKAITPGSIDAPETWYSPILDVVFGVE